MRSAALLISAALLAAPGGSARGTTTDGQTVTVPGVGTRPLPPENRPDPPRKAVRR